MKRKASATWKGNLKEGNGTVSTESKVLSETHYSFDTRFESGTGTNPEELVAAAHAACFSMALSLQLGEMGFVPEQVSTAVTVSFEKVGEGWTVTESHLDVTARVPGIDAEDFAAATQNAKVGCPISRLLKTNITMDAKLVA
jgi:lipoyl-dependent peroxiredoxin